MGGRVGRSFFLALGGRKMVDDDDDDDEDEDEVVEGFDMGN